MRPVWYLNSLDIYAPIIPQSQHFPQKNHPGNLCKKTSPVPLKGDGGTVLALLTARKMPLSSEASGGPRPAAQRTAQGHHGPGDQKGEVNMTTPTASELLVQQAREAERLRLLLLASECKDLDEFRQRLRDLLNKVKRRATPPRHGPTLSTTARAASSPPPCRLYSTTAAGKINARRGGSKKFPREGEPPVPEKIAKKCLTKRHATVYAESTERHATVNGPTSRKGKTP